MIKDEKGQRKIEQGTNEDMGGLLYLTCYHQADQCLFVVLVNMDFLLIVLFCCFVYMSYDLLS